MCLSSVAGIRDRLGGYRVVVGPLESMSDHVMTGERLFIVPGLLVREPVPSEDIAELIDKVQRYLIAHGGYSP